ncbi:hybrid sensor histidine kinase/response regulator transcription factor [Telluribacter sp. SYSU D00476]|uniref:hybrid sensor histidine kinase/response regulator transcription factor n=1 Tax=Telluribacter sp. SYSU D00476 TaxID=2811430 RepID=UPI0021D40282|nr:hybrid sensor histidine kinase/response regulator transcription factor [Telluribacter sp. SYSU D00476]
MKWILKPILYILLCTSLCWGQYSNKIRFKNLTVNDGLSFPVINCFLQDKQGFMWVGTEFGLNRYDSQKFKVFYANPSDSHSLSSDYITCLYEDTNNYIWVGTLRGLNIYDKTTSQFRKLEQTVLRQNSILAITGDSKGNQWVLMTHYLLQVDSSFNLIKQYQVRQITQENNLNKLSTLKFDKHNQLWVNTNKGLRLFNFEKEKLTNPLDDVVDFISPNPDIISVVFIDSKENIWVGTRGNGARYYSMRDKKWHHLTNLSSKYINGIVEDINQRIWICTGRNGLDIYDPSTQKVEVMRYAKTPESNMASNSLSCIYADRLGGIWIGTFNSGLMYYFQHQLKFNLYYSKGQISGINSNYVTSFATDRANNIWLGVGEEGLLFFDRKTATFRKIIPKLPFFKDQAELKEHFYILSLRLSEDQTHLFIGTLTGFYDYHITTGTWKYNYQSRGKDNTWPGGMVGSIIQDRDIVYLTTSSGLSLYNYHKGTFEHFTIGGSNRITYTLAQNDSTVFVGTSSSGLWSFDKRSHKFVKVIPAAMNVKVPERIRCLYMDRNQRLIVGASSSGLYRYNHDFTKVEAIQNSPDKRRLTFMSLCEDPKDGYWTATNQGMVKLSESFKIERIFNAKEGFDPSYFFTNAITRSKNNEILVGGNVGFYSFYSSDFYSTKVPHLPPIHLRDVLVLNKSVVDSEVDGFKIEGDLSVTRSIELPNYQSLITFEYTDLDYQNSDRIEYAYRLEPYEKAWNLVSDRRFATYRDLPAGTYTFKVRGQVDNQLVGSSMAQLQVVIPPKPWQTWWAYLIYMTVALLVGRQWYVYQSNKRRMRQEIEMQKFQREKMEELYKFKIDFFTQVTHELRTPLTLIISPLEEMIRRSPTASENNLLKIIHRNAQKLLLTVNQLLDFRKIENSDMKVFAKKGNIVSFAEEVLFSFLKLTEKKGIELLFETNMEKYPFVLFDKDIMEKILVNLIGNAVKFTQQGSVQVKVYEPEDIANSTRYFIEITDTGQGIKPENIKNVFESFFQENRNNYTVGSGIGLKIVKELTSLHRGTIEVTSEVDRGTCFLLSFPKADLDLMNEEPVKPSFSQELEWNASTEKPTIDKTNLSAKILIVDDEPDVLSFLEEIFESDYYLFSADSAQKALDIAKTELPDLIVSDVMMPGMSGLELCEYAKTDFLLGHIPIVLLTALNATEHEIEGLRTGADAYIPKPFPVNLLKATVQNLLNSRKKLKQAFLNSSLTNATNVTQNNTDKLFLEKVIAAIDSKLDQTDLEIGTISDEMGMSQSTFYRKLKSLTDLSGNEFIRTIRLKRAADLLRNTDCNISEIAYRVGFSDPKYFSTCFRKFYNLTPTEYLSQARKDKTSGHLT